MGESTPKAKTATPVALYIGLAAASAIAAFAAVYVMLGAPDNAVAAPRPRRQGSQPPKAVLIRSRPGR